MKNPEVLIVTPSFNRAALIEATIESVLKQTYKNMEYIVVDGGSTDGTLEILEKYRKEGKLKYISEPDNGMYDAINKGFRMASGEILAYLNSDDIYFPWTISTAVDALINKD
ncbi:MAG TPA: glycosyltransferase, partial [Syntrophales bacterium]|nr:glycosyltransferase [Syntrophales bacterium]